MEANQDTSNPRPDARHPFVELLEWVIAQVGGPRRLVKERVVSAETLRRWREGQIPAKRTSSTVQALEMWARENVQNYPPEWAPMGGFVSLADHRTEAGSPPAPPTPDQVVAAQSFTAPQGDQFPSRRRNWKLAMFSVGCVSLIAAGLTVKSLTGNTLPTGKGGDPVNSLTAELAGNKKGSPVFANPSGAPAPDEVPNRIPYGTLVQVSCTAPDQSGMESVTAFYLIVGGDWDGLYVVADTMTNGGSLGDTSTPNVDPRVPSCAD